MAKVDKEVLIKAPLEKIFGHIMEPVNLLEFWPSLMEIRDIQSLPNGGYSARWMYKMLGVRFSGTAEYTQVVPNRFLVIETKGGITSTIAWTVRSWKDKTRVTLSIEYRVPVPLLGKLAEAIVLKMNDHEADLMMVNLQARFFIANH
jgi:uncharacterized membrane protein